MKSKALSYVSERLFVWILRILYSRFERKKSKFPDGIPTVRDIRNRCAAFEYECHHWTNTDCLGDGHYLCKECCHLDRDERIIRSN